MEQAELRSRRLVFLVSYPKSGNTWLRLLIGSYFYNHERAPVADLSDFMGWPFLELTNTPLRDIDIWEHGALRPAAMYRLQESLPENSWATVKSHHANGVVGGVPLFARLFVDRAVVIIRDPRDVLPSMAAWTGLGLEDAVELMRSKDAIMPDKTGRSVPHITTSWSVHVGSWLRQRRVPHLVIKYEDMHADTAAVLTDVLTFLGEEEVDATRVQVAVDAQAFDALKEREDAIGFAELGKKTDRFFRRGVVGGWRDDVPPELVEQVEKDHAEVMARVGYEPEFAHA